MRGARRSATIALVIAVAMGVINTVTVEAVTADPPRHQSRDTRKNDILLSLDGLFTMRTDGTHLRRITSGRHADADASWSPNGKRVVFSRFNVNDVHWDLYTIRSNGRNLRRLTRTSKSERDPVWSPSGGLIAFERGRDGVFLIRPDGSGLRRVSRRGVIDADPTWSPNGNRLAVVSDRHRGRDFDVYVIKTDGKTVKRLTRLPDGEFLELDWGNRGWLAFDFYRGGRSPKLYVIRSGGRKRQRIGRRGDIRPVWSPSGRKLVVAVSSGPDELQGIWQMNRDGSARIHLTNDGAPLDWIRR
jgi:Tol biopolymer transport system component